MSHPADRNLLLGVLALQMDFITSEALLEAMKAWTFEKDRKLEEILIDRGALDRADLDALGPVLDRHLARHGGDPASSIASLRDSGSSLEALRVVEGTIAGVNLDQTYATRAPLDPYATIAHAFEAREGSFPQPRYHRLRLHAKGNLGEVFVAFDDELHREVALKQMKDRNADDPGSRSRFCFEAEVTGGLEHPGIVPVYGLGRYEDGRPYYAMRFIRGDSLADSIAAFHSADGKKLSEGTRMLALQKLLRRFLDVCNAVAYAHSRGVLHRDLKPSNIMVGKYGETLVVDWGLARPIARQDSEAETLEIDEPPLQARSGSDVSGTVAGSVVGTPRYMPPEQAAGRLDQLGPTSDVYSLGATLYHILTGSAPFSADSILEVLQDVQKGKFSPPRSIDPSIPKALDAITMKAMSLRQADRYATPVALATDLEHWLADEPTVALVEDRIDRIARWNRRHRAASLSAAATLAAVAIAATAAVFFIAAAERETSRALETAQKANALATKSSKEAHAEAEKAKFAEARISQALIAAKQANQDANRAKLQAEAEADNAKLISQFLVGLFEETDPLAVAGRSFGLVGNSGHALTAREIVDRGAKALTNFRGSPLLKATLLDAIGNVYVDLAAIEEGEKLLLEALEIRRSQLPPNHPDLAASFHSLGWAKEVHVDPAGVGLFREALAIRLANNPSGDDPAVASTQFHLALALVADEQDTAEVMDLLQKSLETRRKDPRLKRELAIQLVLMGYIHTSRGETLQAARYYGEAATLLKLGGDGRLANVLVKFTLAEMTHRGPNPKLALASYQACTEESEKAFGRDHIVTGYFRSVYAERLLQGGKAKDAVEQYRINVETAQRQKFPDKVTGGIIVEYARAIRDSGDAAEGERQGRIAIQILEACKTQSRAVRSYLAHAYYIVGIMASNRGDRSETNLDLLRNAAKMRREIYGPDTEIVARTLYSLGNCAGAAGNHAEALQAYKQARDIARAHKEYEIGWRDRIDEVVARLEARLQKGQ